MSIRYGNTCRAFGGLIVVFLCFGTALAQQDVEKPSAPVNEGQGIAGEAPTPEKDSGESAEREQAPPAEPLPTSPAIISEADTEEACGPRCEAAQQREKDDLGAQQDMARFAGGLVDLTLWQLIVGGVGIALLVGTLALTVRATNAAVDANRIARESAERQLRAYVFVKDALRTRRCDSDPWALEIHIKNFGQTPAYRARFRYDFKVMDRADVATFEFPLPDKDVVRFDFAPGHEHTIRPEIPELTGRIWNKFKAGQMDIYLWGRIDFIDAFDEHRWSRFRLVQTGGYLLNLFTSPEGNETSESQNF